MKWPYDATHRRFVPPSTEYYLYMDYYIPITWEKLITYKIIWKNWNVEFFGNK